MATYLILKSFHWQHVGKVLRALLPGFISDSNQITLARHITQRAKIIIHWICDKCDRAQQAANQTAKQPDRQPESNSESVSSCRATLRCNTGMDEATHRSCQKFVAKDIILVEWGSWLTTVFHCSSSIMMTAMLMMMPMMMMMMTMIDDWPFLWQTQTLSDDCWATGNQGHKLCAGNCDHTHWQADRQTDRQTDGRMDRERDRHVQCATMATIICGESQHHTKCIHGMATWLMGPINCTTSALWVSLMLFLEQLLLLSLLLSHVRQQTRR